MYKCDICKLEKNYPHCNGYGECGNCSDKRVSQQRAESGLKSDFGEEAKQAIKNAIAEFPKFFGLRAYPGDVFRIGERESYVSQGKIFLYTQRLYKNEWNDFVKGSVPELKSSFVKLSDDVLKGVPQ